MWDLVLFSEQARLIIARKLSTEEVEKPRFVFLPKIIFKLGMKTAAESIVSFTLIPQFPQIVPAMSVFPSVFSVFLCRAWKLQDEEACTSENIEERIN